MCEAKRRGAVRRAEHQISTSGGFFCCAPVVEKQSEAEGRRNVAGRCGAAALSIEPRAPEVPATETAAAFGRARARRELPPRLAGTVDIALVALGRAIDR